MKNNYSATYSAGLDPRDAIEAALGVLPSTPDGMFVPANGQLWVGYETVTLTAGQVTTFQNAVSSAIADMNAPWRNASTMQTKVAGALVRLRQIKTQATAFQGQTDYTTANLASLNDLLHKSQSLAIAVNDLADDLIALARLISGQFDSVS